MGPARPLVAGLQSGGGCVLAHAGGLVGSGEGVARSRFHAGLLRARPFQPGVRFRDGNGGEAGVRRSAAVRDGQGDGIRKRLSRPVVLGGNGYLNLVRISRILRVRSNAQRVVHNRHFQNAALVRISIVALVFWVLVCDKVFPIHADRQRNEVQRGRDFAFKLHLHLNFSNLIHAYGEIVRYNPETGHTVDRLAGGAVRGRPVPVGVLHQGHIRLRSIGQKLEITIGGIGGHDIGVSPGCRGRRCGVTRGGTIDGHLGCARHLAVDHKGLARSQNQKTAVSVKARDGVLEFAEI